MKGSASTEEKKHKPAAKAVAVPSPTSFKMRRQSGILERDVVGNFLLKLYHELHILPDGYILKETVRNEFDDYTRANNYAAHFIGANIGTLFYASKFLLNSPKNSNTYRISIPKLIEFRDQKLKILQKDYAGSFLLTLLHQAQIERDGRILKSSIRSAFQKYLQTSPRKYQVYFSDVVIGTLLRNNHFLCNTPRKSELYRIATRALYKYRNDKLKQMDESQSRIQNYSAIDSILPENAESSNDKPLEAAIEVSTDAEEFPVIYQGGCLQKIEPLFKLTSTGCFICQKNFKMQSDFEEHISTHGFETDFEFLSSCQQRQKHVFEVVYRLCNESHYFYFTMKTKEKDLIVDKIIIVQTRLLNYVKNDKVPYEISTDGIDSFLADSHLFTKGVEQPIVVVYRYKFDKNTRFVEQHHFLRTEEFPQVHFPIRSCRVPHYSVLKVKTKLQEYLPSLLMKSAQESNFSDEFLSTSSRIFGKYLENKHLNAENMYDVLNTLVQIEDLDGMRGYAVLRQEDVKIKRFGKEYSVKLKLPKHIILENIVTPLDEIILIPSNKSTSTDLNNIDEIHCQKRKVKSFFAFVERVYYNQVCFTHDSVICEKRKYNIILRPSRLPLRYQYRAINMLANSSYRMRNYLYPSTCNHQREVSVLDLEVFNPSIESNPEQMQAVQNIASGPHSFAPYIIFGPPGTGKTSTIVEAVLQLWKRRPDTRILITAGSNSACDEVAIRLCRVLIDLQPEKPNILRIFARSNEKRRDAMDDILIEASNFYRAHFYPAVEVIREYRIIVCTLSVVGKLVSGNIGMDFFTHVIIDECGASTESEVLVGWMGTSSLKTRLIISGDHKQLGPIIRSKRASDLGLSLSFMERLMNLECYGVNSNGDYDRSIQTRLVNNFRSHPKIVDLYNQLYYGNELKPMANKDDTEWVLQWHLLPNKNHPIIFHSVYGTTAKGTHSSLCNQLEINTVMDYVKDLMYFGIKGRKIEETDIGIISPYKQQYTQIQEELNQRRWHYIEVGAVETFQGKEKPIIIVSTVRSFTKTLGFLDNPKRLNVMLSRAKALLIIIGNPKTLSQNHEFKYIIDECRKNKCTIGGFRGYDDETPQKKEILMAPVKNPLKKKNSFKNNNPNISDKLCEKIYESTFDQSAHRRIIKFGDKEPNKVATKLNGLTISDKECKWISRNSGLRENTATTEKNGQPNNFIRSYSTDPPTYDKLFYPLRESIESHTKKSKKDGCNLS